MFGSHCGGIGSWQTALAPWMPPPPGNMKRPHFRALFRDSRTFPLALLAIKSSPLARARRENAPRGRTVLRRRALVKLAEGGSSTGRGMEEAPGLLGAAAGHAPAAATLDGDPAAQPLGGPSSPVLDVMFCLLPVLFLLVVTLSKRLVGGGEAAVVAGRAGGCWCGARSQTFALLTSLLPFPLVGAAPAVHADRQQPARSCVHDVACKDDLDRGRPDSHHSDSAAGRPAGSDAPGHPVLCLCVLQRAQRHPGASHAQVGEQPNNCCGPSPTLHRAADGAVVPLPVSDTCARRFGSTLQQQNTVQQDLALQPAPAIASLADDALHGSAGARHLQQPPRGRGHAGAVGAGPPHRGCQRLWHRAGDAPTCARGGGRTCPGLPHAGSGPYGLLLTSVRSLHS